jgi:type I restriction enzyme S subunit
MVVQWRDLPRWDLKTARASAFRLAHPGFRPLGDFAEEATELVRPWDDPEKDWPVFGGNNEVGVVFSHHQRGETFNAPYKRVRKDWFFHNPTRANVGSLGRVPDVPDDAITSPEYQVWRIKRDLLPEYVQLLIQTPFFIEQIAFHRVGAVKERLFVQNLLEIPIPVVPFPVQQKIVATWEAAQKHTATTAAKIERLERDVEARFLADLGFQAPEQAVLPKVFAVWWRDLERWGVEPNQLATVGVDISRCKYPVAMGRDCLAEVKHGCSASPSPTPTALEVLKISAATRGYLRPEERKCAFDVSRHRHEFGLRSGDVLMCRTNGTLALVGMSALVETNLPNLIFPDKLIRVRCKANILPAYFWMLVQLPFARSQIESVARTAVGNYAIGSEDIWAMRFPLPPLTVQQAIVNRVEAGRAEIAALKAEAQARVDAAKADVEAMILGTRFVDPGQAGPILVRR